VLSFRVGLLMLCFELIASRYCALVRSASVMMDGTMLWDGAGCWVPGPKLDGLAWDTHI
jgi:hypothetical protein